MVRLDFKLVEAVLRDDVGYWEASPEPALLLHTLFEMPIRSAAGGVELLQLDAHPWYPQPIVRIATLSRRHVYRLFDVHATTDHLAGGAALRYRRAGTTVIVHSTLNKRTAETTLNELASAFDRFYYRVRETLTQASPSFGDIDLWNIR